MERKGERRKGRGKERGEGEKGMREEEVKEVKREGRVNGGMKRWVFNYSL